MIITIPSLIAAGIATAVVTGRITGTAVYLTAGDADVVTGDQIKTEGGLHILELGHMEPWVIAMMCATELIRMGACGAFCHRKGKGYVRDKSKSCGNPQCNKVKCRRPRNNAVGFSNAVGLSSATQSAAIIDTDQNKPRTPTPKPTPTPRGPSRETNSLIHSFSTTNSTIKIHVRRTRGGRANTAIRASNGQASRARGAPQQAAGHPRHQDRSRQRRRRRRRSWGRKN
jgi:hypothetical protein